MSNKKMVSVRLPEPVIESMKAKAKRQDKFSKFVERAGSLNPSTTLLG
jgi:hypothetical protein